MTFHPQTANKNAIPTRWLCAWPGLLRLWVYGDFSSLFVAAGFALLLNLAMLSTFVWPQWLGNAFPMVAWPILVLVWIASWFVSQRTLNESTEPGHSGDETSDALFIAAQTEYLKGNWTEAEALLMRQLRFRPRDIEARLLLATLYRHTERFDAAIEQLNQLTRFDHASRWQDEMDRLRGQIQFAFADVEGFEASDGNDNPQTDNPKSSLSTREPEITPTVSDSPTNSDDENQSDVNRAA